MTKTNIFGAFLLLIFITLQGCSGGGGGGEADGSPSIESISINGLAPSYIESTQREISVLATYSDGHTATVSGITWSTDEPSVIVVNSNNMLIASQPGSATITASLDGIEVSAMVDVIAATLTGIDISSPLSSTPLGLSVNMSVLGTYNNGQTRSIDAETWSSSNELIAEVSPNGIVTTLSEGEVTISVVEGDFASSFVLTVSEAELTAITISSDSYTLAAGFSISLTASGVYTNNQTIEIEDPVWMSSVTSSVSIDNQGNASGLVKGTSQITASKDGLVSSPVTVNVTDAVVVDFELNVREMDIPVGLSEFALGVAIFSDGSRTSVTPSSYESSNSFAFSVDTNGEVTGLDLGVGNLLASYGAFTDSIRVEITDAVVIGIEISPSDSLSIPLGVEQLFSARSFYSDGTNLDVTESVEWTSTIGALTFPETDKPTYAASELGSGVVQARYMGFTSQTEINSVAAIPLTLSLVDQEDSAVTAISLPIGIEEQLQLIVTFTDQSKLRPSSNVSWSLSDPLISNLSADGSETVEVTGLDLGDFFLRVSYGGLDYEIPGEVTAAIPLSLSLSDQTVYLDDELALQGELTFSDGSSELVDDSLLWSVDDADTATISNALGSEGDVELLAQGSVLVSATFGSGGSITADMVLTILQPRIVTGFETINPNVNIYRIGEDDYQINLQFSQRDQNRVAFYNEFNGGVSLATGPDTIDQIVDTAANDFSLRLVDIENNSDRSIAIVRNPDNIYGVIQLHDVRHAGRDGDIDSIAFSWAIRTDGGTDFSGYQPDSNFVFLTCFSGSIIDPSGCERISTPYSLVFNSNVTVLPAPANHSIGEYTLIALSQDIQATDLSAQDLNGLVLPFFDNLSSNQVVLEGDSVPFSLRVPATGGNSVRPVFQLSIDHALNDTFSVSGTFVSN